MGVEASRLAEYDTTPLSSEGARIFRADANRTFRSEPNRVLMIKLLFFAQTKFGAVQSMGYVAGLLLLFFDPPTVFKVLTVLNDSPKYLEGYWRGEATACAVDGYVCLKLLKPTIRDRRARTCGLLCRSGSLESASTTCRTGCSSHFWIVSSPRATAIYSSSSSRSSLNLRTTS
ncbi:unnamed protein product [Prorocentrum cordatum]|uniref:Uncharacterized protein n=1 Tax=Prorocentrum cordatum TaxID=2364126 RepID=A0ABN9X164_9DINO|nr:unnamed protein product [Polarella glacialis]